MVETEILCQNDNETNTDDDTIVQYAFLFDEDELRDYEESLQECVWDTYDQIALERMSYESY